MSDYRVIILAAGEQKRWASEGYKQMCTVQGVPVIERTILQVRDTFLVEPIIAIRGVGKPFGKYQYFYPREYDRITDTLASTEPLWGQENIILLGDTYYPDVAMDLIYLKDFPFFGDINKIFAVKFVHGQIQSIKSAIQKARTDKKSQGKLWNMYRAYDGIAIDKNEFGPSFYKFKDADDPTDFDTHERYNKFIEGLK